MRGWNNGGAAGGEKRAADGGGGLGRALRWTGGAQGRVGLWTLERRLPQGRSRRRAPAARRLRVSAGLAGVCWARQRTGLSGVGHARPAVALAGRGSRGPIGVRAGVRQAHLILQRAGR